MPGVARNIDGRRPRIPSWVERYRFVICLALVLVGLATFQAIEHLSLTASSAKVFTAFAVITISIARLFSMWRGPISTPSRVNRQNRRKYLALAALLWIILFLVWQYRVPPFPK
jgi:surface polysaccharide O-acyltransferase-like enzyme